MSSTPTVNTLINSSNCTVLGNSSTGNALSVHQTGAGNVFRFSNAAGLSNVMVMNNLGQVGIGVTSPSSGMILDVRNTTGLVVDRLLGTTSGNQSNVIVQVGNGSSASFGALKIIGNRTANGSDWTTTSLRIQKYVDVTQMGYMEFGAAGGNTDIAFGTGGTTERMRITSGGNVGIGTTSPGYTLEVSNSTSSTSTSFLSLTNPSSFGFNTGINYGSSIVFRGQWAGDGLQPIVEMCKIDGRKEQNANYGDSYLAFQTRYDSSRTGLVGTLTEKMRISGNGYVGIGTTYPDYWAYGTTTQTAQNFGVVVDSTLVSWGIDTATKVLSTNYQVKNTSGNYVRGAAITMTATSNTSGSESCDLAFSTKPSTAGAGVNERMRITAAGNVGIGTASPQAPLHVNGGVITNSDAISNKRYSYQGSMSAGTGPSVTLTFGQAAFYAKIIAILRNLGNSNNVNTMVLEVQGGNTFGSLSSVAIAIGTKNMFGGANAYPWSPTVTTTATTVVITPGYIDAGAGYSYDIFVELVSGSGGTLASITQATTVVKTFSY